LNKTVYESKKKKKKKKKKRVRRSHAVERVQSDLIMNKVMHEIAEKKEER